MQQIINELKTKLNPLSIDARRLFHGRGHTFDGLSFINIDSFPPVLLITLYCEPEKEWMHLLLNEVISMICDQADFTCLMVQHRYRHGGPFDVVWGVQPSEVIIGENGLRFQLRLGDVQNCGFFLDMATGRQWIKENAKGKNILNLFAYTCSLSVAAFAGSAQSVVNIDMNKNALNIGRINHRLNDQQKRRVRFLDHNIFKSWGKLKRLGPYNLLIIDPPAFQRGSFSIKKDYRRLIHRIPELMPNGGEVLASSNSPDLPGSFLLEIFEQKCPQSQQIQQLKNAPDFPEKDPDKGLKLYHFRIDPTSSDK